MRFFGSFPLFNEAGDGDGGGDGGAGAGAGGQAPGPAAGDGDDAPVTRAEFNALMSKLDKLAQPPAVPEKPKGKSKDADDMPGWAKALESKLDGLTEQQKSQQLASRKQQLVNAALADIPEANRGLASLALEGLMVNSGVSLDGDVDVAKLAGQLGGVLRSQHASLFTTPGSPYKAIPKAANGGYDWDSVSSLSDVPPDLISKIPDDVWARLRSGGQRSGGSTRPYNKY